MHGGADGTVAIVYPQENALAVYMTQSRDHLRNYFETLLQVTPPFDQFRKWNYNNEFLDRWKTILNDGPHTLSREETNSFSGTFICETNRDFDAEIFTRENQLILKTLKSGREIPLLYDGNGKFICWYVPPHYGFVSEITFQSDGSFILEWINTTKFEFSKTVSENP